MHDAKTVRQVIMSSTTMQGFWRIAIYNPMLVHQIGYNLTAVKVAECLNECSGHGQCDSNGACHCDANWAGGDCSVNKNDDCQVGALLLMGAAHPLPPADSAGCQVPSRNGSSATHGVGT